MNIRQIKTLFDINLRYANPQATNQSRKRGKSGKKLTNSLLLQSTMSGAIFLVIFTLMMLTIDFPKYPGYFGLYCMLYLIFAASQAFGSLHNVMYESKDLKDLLPLPIANSSIFFAKFLTVAFTVFPYALPLLSLFLMAGLRGSGIIGIILAVLIFLVFVVLLMALCTWLISLLVQTKFFQRFKKTANTILLVLPIAGSLGAYFYLISQNNSRTDALIAAGKFPDRHVIPIFMPAFDALVHPISLGSLLFWALSLIVLALLYLVLQKNTIPKMFELQLSESPVKSKKKTKKRTSKGSTSLSRQLLRYNFGLIKNPTLWMQTLSNGYIMPFAMVFGASMMGDLGLSQLSARFFATFFLAGGFFAILTTNVASICALIISLDREDFPYIRSLPMSLEFYLRAKFHFAVGLQLIMNTLALIIISVLLHLPPLLFLALFLGNLIIQYIYSQYFYYRDFRLLNPTWTNISQLYSRGGGNWMNVAILFGGFIGGFLIIGLSAFLLAYLPLPLLANIVLIAITLAIFLFVHWHYRKVFWRSDQIH